ncbi:MAG TPA: SMI1/KNR4 family protein [Kofleriaceae bacterium]|nr:SMI1/KNR4 family protein [Kofleriaceae bacterium]
MTLLALHACGGAQSASPIPRAPDHRIANLHALARLYGVVRWFHPCDAASAIDWDRLAIDAARRVLDPPDRLTLRARLTELFAPTAPTVHIVGPGEPFPDEPSLQPGSTDGLDVIAWQHRGYGVTRHRVTLRINKPPTDAVRVRSFESAIGFRLPGDYREFLLHHDGGRPYPASSQFTSRTGPDTNSSVEWFQSLLSES